MTTTTAPTATAAAGAGHSPTTEPPAPPGLPAGYAYEWARFVDWCTATDTTALPAHPVTVAEFLHDHPAPPPTQRRRLAAVTAAHTTAGHPSPARAAAIRALLHPVASTDGQQAAGAARPQAGGDVLSGLASTGWPHGLFGRRDALLVLLTGAGLGPAAAVRLHRADLTTTADGQLQITTGPFDRVLLPPARDTRRCPGCVHRRWTDVLDAVHTDPTRRTLRATLHATTAPTADSPHPCAQPPAAAPSALAGDLGGLLLTRIDGWGWLPWEDHTGLTPKAAARIVHAHRTGAPPTHRALPAPDPGAADPGDQDEAAATTPPPPAVPHSTAADRAARAAAAARRRRADLDTLTAATDALTGLDARLQDLLQRTLDLLDDPATTPKPGTRQS